ncbi:hypothetical protein [Rossellomorea arthrocnemi]|jgi:hypothetical protein|uniref:hypothetical protein n=1 Tax=Rossellomorea arthrocnemi TaxID=2769542 RepID=UPI001919843D|nr:hypothetical protein [Rossellomorea arthrocnemi]
MKRKMKALLVIQVIVMMILSSMPLSVFAEEYNRSSQKKEITKVTPLAEGKKYKKTDAINDSQLKGSKAR